MASPEWLADRLRDDDIVILEISFYEPDTAAYYRGHIPGAQYVYWKDLLWNDHDREFPEPAVMAARLGTHGVSNDTTVVLVGDPIQFATYAYWVLAMTGFEDRAVVLDGGHETWESLGLAMTDEIPEVGLRTVTPGPGDGSCRIGRDEVLAGLDDPGRILLDLRSTEEYTGQRVSPPTAPYDHGAERRGRIPGARHLPHEDLLDSDGRFKGLDELAAEFAAVGMSAEHEVVTTCRLSHRASLGWFVLTRLLGRDRVRVYDGSWTEWGSIVGFPIER